MSQRALFLDRDGTLIVDRAYLSDPAGVALLPGVLEALRTAQDLGYALFLFTNQSGIGRGYFTLADAVACNDRLIELLGLGPDVFRDICIAPESPDQPSPYRKPSPRFITESIAKHGLDPAQCLMVGDRPSDVQSGVNAAIAAAAVCTGELTENEWRALALPGVSIHADFPALVATLR